MISIEEELFTAVAKSVRNTYSNAFVVGEYVMAPARFPCVSIVEMDNSVHRQTRDSGHNEMFVDVMYEVNVYSNKSTGKKAECKAIIQLIDDLLLDMGFTRTFLNPVQNLNDATIYRMTGRYRALIDKDKTIYRR